MLVASRWSAQGVRSNACVFKAGVLRTRRPGSASAVLALLVQTSTHWQTSKYECRPCLSRHAEAAEVARHEGGDGTGCPEQRRRHESCSSPSRRQVKV